MSAGLSRRIDYLEGLRGLAAILIVLHHYAQAFVPGVFSKNPAEYHLPLNLETWLFNTPLKLPASGSLWLYVFLILSGIVITYSFHQKGMSLMWLMKLCLNRYFRLIGPIMVAGVLIFLAMKGGLAYNQQAAQISGSSWWLQKQWQFEPTFKGMVQQQMFQIFYQVLPIEVAYNSSLWVIPYFFFGTFLLATLLGISKKIKMWRYLIYILGILLTLRTLYFPLILGIILGERLVKGNIKTSRWGWLTLTLGIYFGTYPTWTEARLIQNSWYTPLPSIPLGWGFEIYHAIGAVLILISLMMIPQLQHWLANKKLQFLGKVSFSLYVIHVLILNTLSSWLLVSWYRVINYNLILVMILVTCLPLTILLAYWLNQYIEKPMGRLRIRL